MRIFDTSNNEIINPNLTIGYLIGDKIFIKHHPAIEAVPEQGHYEIVAEHPDGHDEKIWVVDIPAVAAQDAWDEYEDIYRYIKYQPDALEQSYYQNWTNFENLILQTLSETMASICLLELKMEE